MDLVFAKSMCAHCVEEMCVPLSACLCAHVLASDCQGNWCGPEICLGEWVVIRMGCWGAGSVGSWANFGDLRFEKKIKIFFFHFIQGGC